MPKTLRLLIITNYVQYEEETMEKKVEYYVVPVSPGELLKDEFLVPLGISQYRLAKEIGVPAGRIGQIIANKRAVTVDTDLRLCRYFGLSNGYWLRAQAAYDIEVASRELADELDNIHPFEMDKMPKAV